MKIKNSLWIAVIATLLFSSCKKDKDPDPGPPYVYYWTDYWGFYPTSFVPDHTALDQSENVWYGAANHLCKKVNDNVTDYSASISSFPSSSKSSLTFDNNNKLWIGNSVKGIIVYDGTTFQTYDSTNSGLSDNRVHSITVDAANNKWICTETNIVKYDGSTWVVYDSTNSSLREFATANIVCTPGFTWICGISSLKRFDGTTFTNWDATNSGFPSGGMKYVTNDGNGNLWFIPQASWGEAQTLYKFNGSMFVAYPIATFSYTNSAGFVGLKADMENNIWLYGAALMEFNGTSFYNTRMPIIDYNNGDFHLTHEFQPTISSMVIKSSNSKWFSGYWPTQEATSLYRYH